MALSILRDIEDFEEALRSSDLSAVRGESPGAGGVATPAQAARQLRSLIDRLDSITPYLSLAISSVSLLGSGQQADISPSRLLTASHALSASADEKGAVLYTIPRVLPPRAVSACSRHDTA